MPSTRKPAWHARAACLGHDDPEAFHAPGREKAVIAEYCIGCPVRQECLLDALERRDLDGVWGGTTEKQRRALLRVARGLQTAEDLEGVTLP